MVSLLLLFLAHILRKAGDLGKETGLRTRQAVGLFHLTHTGLLALPYRADAWDLAKATQKSKWQSLSLHLGQGLNSAALCTWLVQWTLHRS